MRKAVILMPGAQKGKPHVRRFLYSVWRNSDDQLMILDGTTEECCRRLHVKKASFRSMVCMSSDTTKYRIIRTNVDDIQSEVDS